MKKLTALITVITIIFSMALPVWADDFVAVSLNDGVEFWAEDDSKINPSYPAENAFDSILATYCKANANESNSLTIDLQKKYILSHVTTTILSAASFSISVSNDEGFSTSTELQANGTQYELPSANAGEAYRYVRLSFTAAASEVRIYDFRAYTTLENAAGASAQLEAPPSFTEELIKISEGKSITSNCYGTGGFGTNVVANAVDANASSQFISCAQRDRVEWVTIDLGEAAIINKIETDFTARRTYGVYVTNTAHGQTEEFTDGVQLVETSAGSKVFELPEGDKGTAFRYIRLRFAGDAPNTGSDTEQNIYIKDISVYKSTRDIVYNAAAQKNGALTDDDTATAVSVENNTIIDLLAPTYIHSYELFGSDKDNVTIKGSLFKTTVDNMEVIPQSTTENKKYRFIAIVKGSGEAVSLNEVKVWSFFTDVVTPWTKNGKNCSVTITNTSHEDERVYTLSATAFDEYGIVMGVNTVTETLAYGESKTVNLEVDGADLADKVVCTVERDGKLLSAPAIFENGSDALVPDGTPYTTAPQKDFDTAVATNTLFDGVEITVSNTGGIVNSDILTLSVYNSANELLAKDAIFADGTNNAEFKYRLPGNADAGEYTAVLSATDAMGNSISNEYPFTKVSPTQEQVDDAVEDFVAADSDAAFQAAYATHYGVISFSDIPEVEDLLTSGIGDSFIRMMGARSDWKTSPSETLTAEDIRDCMKAAVVENVLENSGPNAATVLTKYASVLDNVFDGNQNNTYTAEIFKTGATTDEKLIKNMRRAAALSQMKNATSEEIENVLITYEEILEVNLDKIEKSGEELLYVANCLNDLIRNNENQIPDKFNDDDALKDVIEDDILGGTGSGNGPSGGTPSVDNGYTGENTDVIVKEDYNPTPTPTPQEPEPSNTVTFDDVSAKHWAAESISKLAAAGIVSGRGDGNYDPDSIVSRAEFTTMLVKAFKLISDPEEKPEFADCKVSDWFYPFVDAAVSNDIVNGISQTEFAPNASITRQDSCVMSYQIMIYKNYLKYFAGKTFTDSDRVAAYARDAVNMLSGSGVISGFVDGSFGPYELLSRAQAAVIIDKLMVLLGEEA